MQEFKESSFLSSYAIVLWCLQPIYKLCCALLFLKHRSLGSLFVQEYLRIFHYFYFLRWQQICQVPWVRVTQRETSQRDWSAHSQGTETSPPGESLSSSSPTTVTMSIGTGWFPGPLQTPQPSRLFTPHPLHIDHAGAAWEVHMPSLDINSPPHYFQHSTLNNSMWRVSVGYCLRTGDE